MNSISTAIMALTLLVCVGYIIKLHGKISDLISSKKDDEANLSHLKAKLEKAKEESETPIEPGDSAILPEYGLTTKGDSPISFHVDYEVDIVEVSEDRVKVRATGYASHDSYAKDPANRQSIIAFMQDQWVKKSEIEMVMDEKKRRSIKLNQLGI
jgi:hypothetical protein